MSNPANVAIRPEFFSFSHIHHARESVRKRSRRVGEDVYALSEIYHQAFITALLSAGSVLPRTIDDDPGTSSEEQEEAQTQDSSGFDGTDLTNRRSRSSTKSARATSSRPRSDADHDMVNTVGWCGPSFADGEPTGEQPAKSLAAQMAKVAKAAPLAPRAVLYACGIGISEEWGVPTTLHQLAVLLTTLVLVLFSAWACMTSGDFMLPALTCLYGIGGLAGMLSLCDPRPRGGQSVHGADRFALQICARSLGLEDVWLQRSLRQLVPIALCWSCTTACVLYLRNFEILASISFAMVSGLFTAVALHHLHNCLGLELMIDEFASRFVDAGDGISKLIPLWNQTHALLRRTASRLEGPILALLTSVVPAVVLAAVQVLNHESLTCAPCVQCIFGVTPAVALTLYTFFCTAAVTEKCIYVPDFMNNWILDEDAIDEELQDFVQHILNSAAGFYIKGRRLRNFMVLDATYLICALGFSLVAFVKLKAEANE